MKNTHRMLLILALCLPIMISAHNIGQSHLEWEHDNRDVNGNPTELTGFTISCGENSGQYSIVYNIQDGTARHVTVAELGLSDGVWYCQHVAVNRFGVSAPSTEQRFRLAGGLPVVEGVPAAPGDLRLSAD